MVPLAPRLDDEDPAIDACDYKSSAGSREGGSPRANGSRE